MASTYQELDWYGDWDELPEATQVALGYLQSNKFQSPDDPWPWFDDDSFDDESQGQDSVVLGNAFMPPDDPLIYFEDALEDDWQDDASPQLVASQFVPFVDPWPHWDDEFDDDDWLTPCDDSFAPPNSDFNKILSFPDEWPSFDEQCEDDWLADDFSFAGLVAAVPAPGLDWDWDDVALCDFAEHGYQQSDYPPRVVDDPIFEQDCEDDWYVDASAPVGPNLVINAAQLAQDEWDWDEFVPLDFAENGYQQQGPALQVVFPSLAEEWDWDEFGGEDGWANHFTNYDATPPFTGDDGWDWDEFGGEDGWSNHFTNYDGPQGFIGDIEWDWDSDSIDDELPDNNYWRLSYTPGPAGSIAFTNLPVSVPANFMGMCGVEYPVTTYDNPVSPTGLLNMQVLRTAQQYEFQWNHIQTFAGTATSSSATNKVTIVSVGTIPTGANNHGATSTPSVGDYLMMAGVAVGAKITAVSGSGVGAVLTLSAGGVVTSKASAVEVDGYAGARVADCDAIISFQKSIGSSVIFSLYATPVQYAQTANNPDQPDNVTVGPWSGWGEGSPPTSLQAVTNFATFMLARYNGGGAWQQANPTLGKGFIAAEAWNEPSFNYQTGASVGNGNTAGGTGSVGGSGNGFFWGSAAQMVDIAYAFYTAIKSVDPAVKVISPGFSGESAFGTAAAPSRPYVYLTATGAINTGVTGSQVSDGIGYHSYYLNPPGVTFNNPQWQTDIISAPTLGGLGDWTAAQASGGFSQPIWVTEWGFDGAGSGSYVTNWYAQTQAFRYAWIGQVALLHAIYGVQVWCPWNWGENSNTNGNSGNWQGDTNGVQAAYNLLAATLSGNQIVSGWYIPNSTVSVTLNTGVTLTFALPSHQRIDYEWDFDELIGEDGWQNHFTNYDAKQFHDQEWEWSEDAPNDAWPVGYLQSDRAAPAPSQPLPQDELIDLWDDLGGEDGWANHYTNYDPLGPLAHFPDEADEPEDEPFGFESFAVGTEQPKSVDHGSVIYYPGESEEIEDEDFGFASLFSLPSDDVGIAVIYLPPESEEADDEDYGFLLCALALEDTGIARIYHPDEAEEADDEAFDFQDAPRPADFALPAPPPTAGYPDQSEEPEDEDFAFAGAPLASDDTGQTRATWPDEPQEPEDEDFGFWAFLTPSDALPNLATCYWPDEAEEAPDEDFFALDAQIPQDLVIDVPVQNTWHEPARLRVWHIGRI